MPGRKTRKPRGSRGVTPCIRDSKQRPHHDLMVLLPNVSSSAPEAKTEAQLLVQQLAERLSSTGYTTIAFTHVIYGCPGPEDRPESLSLQPAPIFQKREPNDSDKNDSTVQDEPKKRRKVDTTSGINVLSRLHAVVENLSDVGSYSNTNAADSAATLSLLQEYDLVSLAPRNEATFQAACLVSEADIITLDYTAGRGGVQLPFRIRPSDVKAVVERGAAFELHYAPAILNVHQRKALVQAARSLQMACVGVRPAPRLLFSSGDRSITGDVDLGSMALRSPGDLINLMQTVLGFNDSISYDALGSSAVRVIERGRLRKLGQLHRRGLIDVCLESDFVLPSTSEDDVKEGDQEKEEISKESKAAEDIVDSQQTDDGFITL